MKLELAFISTLLGLISFFWIGIRNEWSKYKEKAIVCEPKSERARVFIFILLPYLVGAIGVAGLVIVAYTEEPEIKFHRWRSISTPESQVNMKGKNELEILSKENHFKIDIEGEFYGPELTQLLRDYGSPPGDLRVYAIVNETRTETKSLFYIQTSEHGLVGLDGKYRVSAYLGGKGEESAKYNELFYVRIYIPEDPDVKFDPRGIYQEKTLPAIRFLSDPVSVITLRDLEKIQGIQ